MGLFPPAGMHINTESLDTVGIMARSVEDIALFRAALMAIPYEPPACRSGRRGSRCAARRIGTRPQPEGRAVLEDARRRLRAAGAEIVEANCRPTAPASPRCSAGTAPSRRRAVHAPELHRHAALLSGDLLDGKIADGRELSLDDFRAAWRRAEEARAAAQRMGRRVRRDPDPAGAGPGAEGARHDRLGRVQRRCGPALHAVSDLAGR